MIAALRVGLLGLYLACVLVVSSEEQSCSDGASARPSASLLQAATNRSQKGDADPAEDKVGRPLEHDEPEDDEHEELQHDDDAEDPEHEESELEPTELDAGRESLLERAQAIRAGISDLEDSIQSKGNRRRRSRRRTTTTTATTTTVNCGSSIDSYAIGWDVSGSTDYCAEGANTGALVEGIDSSKCTESTRDKWLFVDDGNGYCTLKAQYNDGHRRRNHKGTSVTCGTSSMSVAYCKVNGNQGYTKFKLEDHGSNKFSMWWYNGNTAKKAYRASGNGGGIIIDDVTNGDDPNFRVYKNAVYSSTCRLSKADLNLSCWK